MALTIYLTKLASCLTLCFALVSCLGPYYSYERIEPNLPGSVKGEVGLWSANGSPMFCDDGAVYFLGSPSPVLFNAPLGNCTTPQLNVLRSFSILAVVFSGIAFLFASTLDQIIAPKTNNLAALALSSAGLISTFIVIGTFSDYVDPTRADNNYGACELSPSFSGLMCDERLEWGFWFNVATALTQVSSICMFSCKLRSLKTDSLHEYAPDQTTALLLHMATFAKVLHFVEFCAILVATFGAYVKVRSCEERSDELGI
ncbi:hypothetical protein TL16_g04995 [Triparma laevis f. inornata]|uniref:Transmembrane protein n=1 Tax=Triparma laevis f. inornata TaxID=1714386 RepID=A0A9W7EAA5_9STRA|nr:hypothetical protein TL16_g04995 [Triparma laevis f. inornata]